MSLFEKLQHQIPAKAGDALPRAFSVSIWRAADIDELLEKARGFHLRFMQLDRGPFVAAAMQTQVDQVLLSAANFGRSLVQSGETPAGTVTFLVRTSADPALWQGRRWGLHELLVIKPGVEVDAISQSGYGVTAASFPRGLVNASADRFGWSWTPGAPTSLLIGLTPEKSNLLRTTFETFFEEAAARPFDERAAAWALSKQEDLLRVLLQCIPDAMRSAEPRSSGERARVLEAALAAIHDRPEDVLTVGDLCRIARASERTLHHAFTERFGLAPAHYMKAYRLNAARNDLSREHEPLMKIADVANKWGFWHLGQFAQDYRSLFGELPSETYARKHGTLVR
jgi:AraC-like DNA-binding protein